MDQRLMGDLSNPPALQRSQRQHSQSSILAQVSMAPSLLRGPRSSLTLLLAVATFGARAQLPIVIGEEQSYAVSANTTGRTARSDGILATGATFMTVHFSYFSLAEGDKVVVYAGDGQTSYEYTGLGRGDLGNQGGFFTSQLPGSQATIKYVPSTTQTGSSGAFGYTVDKITRSTTPASLSTVCGVDNTEPIKCLLDNTQLPQAYTKATAVARLFVKGTSSCTGWLVGSEGHLITNNHCIGSAADAAMTDFEFKAESTSCSDQCEIYNGCKGVVAATTATLITTDKALDYTLVKLTPTVDLAQYGYLKLRVAGPTLGEQIYLPQHPKAWAKRIATTVDDGSVSRVDSVDHSSACGDHRLGYAADTQPGSSGSPIIAASDNNVIGLHNCGVLEGTCENAAIDVRALVWDLKNKTIVPNDALDNPSEQVPTGPWTPGATSAPTPAPTPAPTKSVCLIFRQQKTCETVVPGNACAWINKACVPNPNLATPAPSPAKTEA